VATPEELDAPVITIEATARPLQWVELVGERYPVRRPKDLVESGPKTAIMKVAAYFAQDSDEGMNRAERRAAKTGKPAPRIELAAEDYAAGTEAVWQYLEVVLDDPSDYAAIRRRVYGPDISDEDATAHTYIECASDPNPGDDIDVTNIVALVTNLMTFWSPEHAETVKSNVRPPGAPKPAAKKAAGTTVKRPAKRPAKRG
jgi:hypothetical protein